MNDPERLGEFLLELGMTPMTARYLSQPMTEEARKMMDEIWERHGIEGGSPTPPLPHQHHPR